MCCIHPRAKATPAGDSSPSLGNKGAIQSPVHALRLNNQLQKMRVWCYPGALRRHRRAAGMGRQADETHFRIKERWKYLFRANDAGYCFYVFPFQPVKQCVTGVRFISQYRRSVALHVAIQALHTHDVQRAQCELTFMSLTSGCK